MKNTHEQLCPFVITLTTVPFCLNLTHTTVLKSNTVCVCVCVLNHVRLFATSWTVACQAPLSMGFSRQEYWNALPFPTSGDLPDPGIEPMSLTSPELAGRFFSTVPPGKLKI